MGGGMPSEPDQPTADFLVEDDFEGNFYQVQNEAHDHFLAQGRITPYDFAVYCALKRFRNGATGVAFPSYPKLAERAGMGRAKAIECIRRLIAEGMVTKQTVKGAAGKKRNLYRLPDLSKVAARNPSTPPSPVSNGDVYPSTMATPHVYNGDPNNTKEQHEGNKGEDAPSAPSPAASREKRPDELMWDAMARVCWPNTEPQKIPQSTRSWLGKVRRELMEAGVDAAAVLRFPEWWARYTSGAPKPIRITLKVLQTHILSMLDEEAAPKNNGHNGNGNGNGHAPAPAGVTYWKDGVEYFNGRALPPRRKVPGT